jgi:lathosterol oxidase
MIASLLATYLAVFMALLVFGYLIPAGVFHWLIYIRQHPAIVEARIQARRHRSEDIAREVRHSIVSLLLFAAYSVALLEAYKAGLTAIYWQIASYPLWWLPVSFLVAVVLHDTYFFWTHRLMHTKLFFKHFHAGHHRSLTPTPWAILAFQPLETVFQFGFFALLIVFVPLHPAVLLAYFMFDGIVNAAGHCGHEIVPRSYREHKLAKYCNAVTHHDLHHSRFNYNFGQYFNVWDRVMGTFLDARSSTPLPATRPEITRSKA